MEFANFEMPKVSVILFENEDVITTSVVTLDVLPDDIIADGQQS